MLVLLLGPVVLWAVVWRRKVTVSTFGVRTNDEIIEEMQAELKKMSGGQS